MDEKILEREAMKLPVRERALLADALLESLDDDAARNVQLAWAAEAEDRIEAYRRGDLSAIDGPSSLKELRSRYRA
jgi:putative addiction module component (TIGR02574 family)